MTHSGAAGANLPNLTFCSVADMSLKMERHRQRTQPFWKSPLHVLGIVICLCLGLTFLAHWSGQKAQAPTPLMARGRTIPTFDPPPPLQASAGSAQACEKFIKQLPRDCRAHTGSPQRVGCG